MNTLAKLQERCQQAILNGYPTPGLFSEEGAELAGGFRIYLQAYHTRLTAALSDNFPVFQTALGDVSFDALAHAYIDQHPSRLRSIRWFGDSLADFLATNPQLVPHPALVDLARMDWATRTAFDAADAPAMLVNDLAALRPEEWPDKRFSLVPSLQLVDLNWRVEPIWKALETDPEGVHDAPEYGPHTLLVWRPKLDCCWRSADATEALILHALRQAATFADCCTLIAEAGDPDPARMAAGFLQRWIAEGLLARH